MRRYPTNYYPPMEPVMYDRGSSIMLGRVIIYVIMVIITLAAGAVALSHAYGDAVATARVQTINEIEEPLLPVKVGAQIEAEIANLQAQAMRVLADAQAYAAAKAEEARLAIERNNLRLAREKLIGEGLITLGMLAAAGGIVVATFTTIRLVDRRLPRPERVGAPRTVTAGDAAPQPSDRPIPIALQPKRKPVPAAPPVLTLRAEDETFRRATKPSPQRAGRAGQPDWQPTATHSGQPLPAH